MHAINKTCTVRRMQRPADICWRALGRNTRCSSSSTPSSSSSSSSSRSNPSTSSTITKAAAVARAPQAAAVAAAICQAAAETAPAAVSQAAEAMRSISRDGGCLGVTFKERCCSFCWYQQQQQQQLALPSLEKRQQLLRVELLLQAAHWTATKRLCPAVHRCRHCCCCCCCCCYCYSCCCCCCSCCCQRLSLLLRCASAYPVLRGPQKEQQQQQHGLETFLSSWGRGSNEGLCGQVHFPDPLLLLLLLQHQQQQKASAACLSPAYGPS